MKIKRLAPLALILPLALLSACGSGVASLVYTPNWFRSPEHPDYSGARERLVYTVSVKEETRNDPNRLYADYNNATYTTTLECFLEGTTWLYRYSTEFSADVRYFEVKSDGEKDVASGKEIIHTNVTFALENDKTPLRPIRSLRSVESLVPDITVADAPIRAYKYTFTVDYNEDLTKAQVAYDDLIDDARDDRAEINLSGEGSYLDNEQILFAMRGIAIANGVQFRTINPVKDRTWKLATVASMETPVAAKYKASFSIGGVPQEEHEIDAHILTLGYTTGNTGTSKRYIYADHTDGGNTYRNVLLEMEEPLVGATGTLVYKLQSADFIA